MKKNLVSICLILMLSVATHQRANAQVEAFIGEIRMFAGNYAPEGWLPCDGRQLQINQYQALYALLGNAYGGNGTTTFNLPNLVGRVPTGAGVSSEGLGTNTVGQKSGQEVSNINVLPTPLNVLTPTGTTAPSGTIMRPVTVLTTPTGAVNVNVKQPSLVITYIICTNGIWPARP